MEIPLANLKAAGAAENTVLDTAIAAAKAVAEEIGPRFRIKTSAAVRDWQPADTVRIQEISHRLGLGKIEQFDHTKVLDAEGFGVVGYMRAAPGTERTNGSPGFYGNAAFFGVLPEFRNRSNLLLNAIREDMRDSKEQWTTKAYDDTAGRIVNYFEKQGLIDVISRRHAGFHTRPTTSYLFQLNNEERATKARQNIVAQTDVRLATQKDADSVAKISTKYGLGWQSYDAERTAVAEAKGHGIVGFAHIDLDRNEIQSLGVLPQFHHSGDTLMERVTSVMSTEQPIKLTGHQFTTGRILDRLDRKGIIEITSKINSGEPLTHYEFIVPRSART
jgi:hypothetical protein